MVPLPGPLPPETIVIQESLGFAVQLQLAAVVRVMSCAGVPAAAKVRLPGATEYVHPLAWLTAKVWPSMTMLALRAGPVLASTVKLMLVVPVPLPGTPVIHAGAPLLVQLQPAVVLTSNELAPPAADALWLVGLSE
jgi:hypothetical protein